ncbi:hypothetical protein J5226_21990 [Lysobacter sp. K5869]|uniref:hypothetical protein n=1 Tax=Lysobacter sp. K5869 TaxID=2820808 RepID=UPI001C0608C9|nr:hypothetical protein [Lysobacter sp. K5869]QWP76229.1 hypothetical protein J5226_21990 [Lysobacter sp. K5869]
MSLRDPEVESGEPKLEGLRANLRATHESGRAGVLSLALAIATAFAAPRLGLTWLTPVAAVAIAVSIAFHCRAAWLATRFAMASLACLRKREDAAPLPERNWLRRFARTRATAAIVAWILVGLVTLLIFPLAMVYAVPAILKAYGLVLLMSALRLVYMAMVDRRFLRELSERSRDAEGPDVIAM